MLGGAPPVRFAIIEQPEFFSQLSHRLGALSDPAAMVRLATEAAGQRLNAHRCYFVEVDDPPSELTIEHDWHRPGEIDAAGRYPARSYGSDAWWAELAQGPVVIPDIAEHPATRDFAASYSHYHTRSCAAVPLSRDGRWVVALVAADDRPRAWTAEEVSLLENVLGRSWPAIELARAAASYRRQAERLSLAMAAAELGDWSWDAQTDLMTISDRTAELFGLAPGTRVTRSQMRDLLHPDDRARAELANREAIRSGADYDIEYRLHHPRLGWRWIATKGRATRGADGKPSGMIGVLLDITRRKEVEESLRERTRTLEILNAVSSALVAEHDPARIVQAVTEAAREISGADFAAFLFQAPNERGETAIRCALSGVSPDVFTRHPPTPPGTVFPPALVGSGVAHLDRCVAVPVISRSGEVLGGLFCGHPEPGRFTAETEKTILGLAAEAAIAIDTANVYRTLEQRVQERTTSLREAIGQMEEFSYSVSHDLRAPLRAMNGYAQALVDDYGERLDATARGYLERIQSSSQRMEKLTFDLLTYSRIARSDVRPTAVNLDKLVNDVINQYVELQPPQAVVTIAAPLGEVNGHESSLVQAAANLLTNAVKFVAPATLPRVRVWTTATSDRVRLWIADNGIGIKPEHTARLFQVFERLPTGDQRYEGTGIGLAIVRKAVEKMNGACGVESDGRNGCRFWLELPKPRMGQ